MRVPIIDLPHRTRAAFTEWLLEHHVDAQQLAVGYAIVRDPDECSLTWRIDGERGREVVTVFSPQPRGSWPAPFPEDLLAAARAA